MSPPAAFARTAFPHLFLEGPQVVIVSSALDPDSLLRELARRGFHPHLWCAKLTGTDTGGEREIRHGFERARALGLHVGGWVQCTSSPRADVASVAPWASGLDFVEWCCEVEYKANPPHTERAALADELVDEVRASELAHLPQAVISYGKRDGYMRVESFARAGWAIVPECYDSFTLADASSYESVWPGRAVHPLVHELAAHAYRGNRCGVYRPEGLL